MTTIYRVWLCRGVRARTEIGLFMDQQVAQHVADNLVLKSGQSAEVEIAELNDSGTIHQYDTDTKLARIRGLLSEEEWDLLKLRQNL